MSKFFKALEQAERERAQRDHGRTPEAGPPAAPSAPPQDITPPSAEPPAPAASLPQDLERPVPKSIRSTGAAPLPTTSAEPLGSVDGHLVSLLNPDALEAEAYRALRHLIEQLHKTADLSVVAISSPGAGDGKTTTAINLAGALAQDPRARVLLVDADLRGSAVVERLGLGTVKGRGLADAILDPSLTLADVVRFCGPFNLSVLSAGQRPGTPYELLASPRLGELLEEARRRYDHIVLDSPPLVLFPDCRVIGKWVDGLLMVVTAHKTPRKLVEEALNVVDPAKLIGLVFNGDDRSLSGYYSYSYARAYDESSNGHGFGWLSQAAKRVGGLFWRRRSQRSRDGEDYWS